VPSRTPLALVGIRFPRAPLNHPCVVSTQRPVAPSSSPFLYGLNIVRSQRDSSVRRGAVVKALALISPYHFVNVSAHRSLHIRMNSLSD
jgi:hypothetical protein